MKKRYLAIMLVLMVLCVTHVKALVVEDCKVLASFKLYSSLDEEKYICKGKGFGSSSDGIYYSGTGNEIVFNQYNGYYFTNYDEPIILKLNGESVISFLHLSDTKVKVEGTGSLKFKQNSFVKKVVNGTPVYQYVYQGKTLVGEDKKIYEGTESEFEDSYVVLKDVNSLPDDYHIDDYELIQVMDYSKMVSVSVTSSWMDDHFDTSLKKYVSDGLGLLQYVKPVKTVETKKEENTLESENVILISEEKVNQKYTLNEVDLKNEEIASKVNDSIDESLISLYDVTVYNGNKQVSMKDGKYTIKIKLDEESSKYEDYKIIYVNDDGDIEEYLDGALDGEYIVFETTHLSQYGVIATVIPEAEIYSVDIKKSNVGNVLKISILVLFSAVSILVIGYILIKSNLLNSKKKKKRRA